MLDLGVATRRGIMCAHREAAYRDLADHDPFPAPRRPRTAAYFCHSIRA